jgi:alkylation response protein AidB-like acyl-CoA dehydrogenase
VQPPRLDLAFTLTADQERFRDELRSWLEANVPREREPDDEDGRFAFRRHWQATLHAAGWAGISWPVEYGGRGAGAIEQFLYYEELAWAGAPEIADTPGLLIMGPTIMVHGTDAQKARYLPRILGAEEIWCQGFSEPGAGSDLLALRCAARPDGDRWIVDGEKVWTTLGPVADQNAVLVRTAEPVEGKRHTGLTMAIVAHAQPGVRVIPLRQITGEHEFAQVFFEGAVADETIGEAGDGWSVALTILDAERADQGFTDHARLLAMLAEIRGLTERAAAERALDVDALDEVRRRTADLAGRCQLLAELNLGRALATGRGERMGSWGSFLKLYWSELWQAVSDLGLDVAGARLPLDRDWAREYLLSKAGTIYSGSSEVQRGILATRILGLPRER